MATELSLYLCGFYHIIVYLERTVFVIYPTVVFPALTLREVGRAHPTSHTALDPNIYGQVLLVEHSPPPPVSYPKPNRIATYYATAHWPQPHKPEVSRQRVSGSFTASRWSQ